MDLESWCGAWVIFVGPKECFIIYSLYANLGGFKVLWRELQELNISRIGLDDIRIIVAENAVIVLLNKILFFF